MHYSTPPDITQSFIDRELFLVSVRMHINYLISINNKKKRSIVKTEKAKLEQVIEAKELEHITFRKAV